MIKDTPSIGRILAMVAFALSVFGLLMFLWLAFGGPLPMKPESYRVKVNFPEAATLAAESDVRIAGVNVGKVKTKELEPGASRMLVEMELKPAYAPVPKNSRAILRQKTLLGETYVELTTGERSSGMLEDGGTLPDNQVEPTTELDEIFGAFDEDTRTAFQDWVAELQKSVKSGEQQDLNDALGNLAPFAVDGATLLKVLNEQETAVKGVVKNTGRVFGAINEREGALRGLIVNSNNTFEALASRDEALAETFEVFPTFLDESKATLARLQRFSVNTRPLVNDLKGPADDLGPTLRSLGDLSPDLEALFRDVDPLIKVSKKGVPALTRFLEGAEPVLENLHPFFQELNPILSFFNFHQSTIAGFITNGAADLNSKPNGDRGQSQVGIIDGRSFEREPTRPEQERGNSYLAPNALLRGIRLGGIESFDCRPSGGEKRDPEDAEEDPIPLTKNPKKRPVCFVQPKSLYDGKSFPFPRRGRAPNRPAPKGVAGTAPASPNR